MEHVLEKQVTLLYRRKTWRHFGDHCDLSPGTERLKNSFMKSVVCFITWNFFPTVNFCFVFYSWKYLTSAVVVQLSHRLPAHKSAFLLLIESKQKSGHFNTLGEGLLCTCACTVNPVFSHRIIMGHLCITNQLGWVSFSLNTGNGQQHPNEVQRT